MLPDSESISKECEFTPIKLTRLVKFNGSYTMIPITLEEAISRSARRVKVLPNGKEVHDTTYLEDKIKHLAKTELKMKLSGEKASENEINPYTFQNLEESCQKRKLVDDKSFSCKKPKLMPLFSRNYKHK